VRSAYHNPEHNKAVGGVARSKHLDGAAFDIAMRNHDPQAFEAAARAVGFKGFGFYPRSGFRNCLEARRFRPRLAGVVLGGAKRCAAMGRAALPPHGARGCGHDCFVSGACSRLPDCS